MSVGGQGTKLRRKNVENFYRLSRVHERHRQTTDDIRIRTDGRATAYSERERELTFAKNLGGELRRILLLAPSNLHSSPAVLYSDGMREGTGVGGFVRNH